MSTDPAGRLPGSRAEDGPSCIATAVLSAGEPAFRRTARRYSLCADDAEDAYQRAVEILLTKAPDRAPPQLAAWMQVVTRREALSVRRSRERLVAAWDEDGPLQLLACERPGPADRAERRERVAEKARVLAALKPDERLAIVLQAHGYTYAEIGELCGWTYTKVNRCLAEGRARLRRLAEAQGSRLSDSGWERRWPGANEGASRGRDRLGPGRAHATSPAS